MSDQGNVICNISVSMDRMLHCTCSPEAVDGGPIALVEEGDLIEIDVMERKLNIIGIAGERKSMEEIDEILAERRKNWKPREAKYKKGVLRLFSQQVFSFPDFLTA